MEADWDEVSLYIISFLFLSSRVRSVAQGPKLGLLQPPSPDLLECLFAWGVEVSL